MPRTCKKCNKDFPVHIWMGGKKRNLKNRRYCLVCSPFGENNRRQLEKQERSSPFCVVCGKKRGKKSKCNYCYWKERCERKYDQVYGIVGTSCWLCGWDKGKAGRQVLEFHHIKPEEKSFGLTKRELSALSWERVKKEMEKCCLLCCRCHRELESGLVNKKDVEEIYREKWTEIKKQWADSSIG